MKGLRQWIGNNIIDFLNKPFIRYKFILPVSDLFSKNSDEEILEKAMRFTAHNGMTGDYLEFGVWKGRSFVRAYHIRNYVRDSRLGSMKFYAFDSFEGLPDINDPNDGSSTEFKKGDYSCDIKTFKSVLVGKGVNMEDVVLVSGWYNEVLNETTKNNLSIKKAAIIHIDCDLYESTVPVLNFVTDYITNGTIIIFDDWFCFNGDSNRGEQRAFREWLAKNPNISATEWQKVNWKTNSFILHKNG